MHIGNVILIVVIIILIAVLISQVVMPRRRRRPQTPTVSYQRDRRGPSDTESSLESSDDESDSESAEHLVSAIGPMDFQQKWHPKPNTVPTFERPGTVSQYVNIAEGGYRFEVSAAAKSRIRAKASALPKNFSAISEWKGAVTGAYDQERCSNCWSFSVSSATTDRIRIKSQGRFLQNGDFISPSSFSACFKCGKEGACPRVCQGDYLDDVLQFMVTNGGAAQSDIDKFSQNGTEYVCFDYAKYDVKLWKGNSRYRVNLFPPSQLNTPENLALNEQAIMEEIFEHGPVCCIFKIFTPMDSRNFYLHKSGIYGAGWKSEPKEFEGYHAIVLLGWGEDQSIPDSNGKPTKYWIMRNSWGAEWGSGGFARILKGDNFGFIECDVWGIDVDLSGH